METENKIGPEKLDLDDIDVIDGITIACVRV